MLISGDRKSLNILQLWARLQLNANSLRAVQMEMTLFQGFIQLGAGLAVGLAGLAAGFAIGIVGDAGVRGTAQQPRLFVGMVRILLNSTLWAFISFSHWY